MCGVSGDPGYWIQTPAVQNEDKRLIKMQETLKMGISVFLIVASEKCIPPPAPGNYAFQRGVWGQCDPCSPECQNVIMARLSRGSALLHGRCGWPT